jgi:TPR repeat protein
MRNWGIEEEECPICFDKSMNTGADKNATVMECCGAKICNQCLVKVLSTEQRDLCPLCRADHSDTSDAASVAKIRARANRGNPNAMYNMGGMYDSGLCGLTQDQALAREWYQKAAEKGETRAAYNLALSHRDGEGGPVDKVMAAKYFRLAAEKNHVQAITCYGIALLLGDGVERNIDEAKKWLRKGADAGDDLAVQQLQMCDVTSAMSGMTNMSFSSSACSDGAQVFSFLKR